MIGLLQKPNIYFGFLQTFRLILLLLLLRIVLGLFKQGAV